MKKDNHEYQREKKRLSLKHGNMGLDLNLFPLKFFFLLFGECFNTFISLRVRICMQFQIF